MSLTYRLVLLVGCGVTAFGLYLKWLDSRDSSKSNHARAGTESKKFVLIREAAGFPAD